MTDYNDGKWHGWNGGECPVHPMSDVQIEMIEIGGKVCDACDCEWEHFGEYNPGDIVAFRVIKAYREPREAWAVGKTLHDTEADAQDFLDRLRSENPTQGFGSWRVIRMVEVLE